MIPRSYLFVPGDSPRKMAKAMEAGAEAVILDLEDSVAASQKQRARRITHEFLSTVESGAIVPQVWLRVNGSDPTAALEEMASLPLAPLAGMVHPKLNERAQLDRVGYWLDALETRDRLDNGSIAIIGIITETPNALVGQDATTLAYGHPRLRGYAWGTEDLSAALGRAPLAGSSNAQSVIARTAQVHCLLMAAAAGVEAIDAVSTDFRDTRALAESCVLARELGYVAKMVIHPNQIETVNRHMLPSDREISWARRVKAVLDENPDMASFSLDGQMIDRPHFAVAERILARVADN